MDLTDEHPYCLGLQSNLTTQRRLYHPSAVLPSNFMKYPSCFLYATICPLHHPQYFVAFPDLSFSSYSTSTRRLIKALPFGFLFGLNRCWCLFGGPSSTEFPRLVRLRFVVRLPVDALQVVVTLPSQNAALLLVGDLQGKCSPSTYEEQCSPPVPIVDSRLQLDWWYMVPVPNPCLPFP